MSKLDEIVCKNFRNKNHFDRHKYASLNTSNIEYFWTLNPHYGRFPVLLNHILSNIKKTVCPKNVWMRQWNSQQEFLTIRYVSLSYMEII